MSNPVTSRALSGRIERRLSHTTVKSSIRNKNSSNNSKRPLISDDVINQMNILLRINPSDFKTKNLEKKLTCQEIKTLASLLISSTKLGMMRKLTKKKTNVSNPTTVRELLKSISLITPTDKNFRDYHVFISFITHILNNENNYSPGLLETYPVYKSVKLALEHNLTPEQSHEATVIALEELRIAGESGA